MQRWWLILFCCVVACQPKSRSLVLPLPQPMPVDSEVTAEAAVPDSVQEPVITHLAKVKTTKGTFTIGLYGYDAPRTVYNFVQLANQGFYDRQHIHRIAKDFVIQFGDPKSRYRSRQEQWGSGGRSIWRVPFEDELNPVTPSYRQGYRRGCVAMANRRIPNTNTSQVFICLQDLPDLPRKFTIFGRVVEGLDVVDSIAAVPIVPVLDSTDGRPQHPIRILQIRARKAPDQEDFRFPKWVYRKPL